MQKSHVLNRSHALNSQMLQNTKTNDRQAATVAQVSSLTPPHQTVLQRPQPSNSLGSAVKCALEGVHIIGRNTSVLQRGRAQWSWHSTVGTIVVVDKDGRECHASGGDIVHLERAFAQRSEVDGDAAELVTAERSGWLGESVEVLRSGVSLSLVL